MAPQAASPPATALIIDTSDSCSCFILAPKAPRRSRRRGAKAHQAPLTSGARERATYRADRCKVLDKAASERARELRHHRRRRRCRRWWQPRSCCCSPATPSAMQVGAGRHGGGGAAGGLDALAGAAADGSVPCRLWFCVAAVPPAPCLPHVHHTACMPYADKCKFNWDCPPAPAGL